MKGKGKEPPPAPVVGFSAPSQCTLPVWDDNQIAQEDWGAALAAGPSAGGGTSATRATLAALGVSSGAAASGKDGAKSAKSGKEAAAGVGVGGGGGGVMQGAGGTAGFVDSDGRAPLQKFVGWCLDAAAGKVIQKTGTGTPQVTSATAPGPQSEGVPAAEGEATSLVSPKNHAAAATPVQWRRPVEIVKPLRPLVHRNPTPFLNPYATEAALRQPFEAKLEEARFRVDASGAAAAAGGAAPGGSAAVGNHRASLAGGGKGSRQSLAPQGGHAGKDAGGGAAPGHGPWHHLYPETVSLLEDLVGQDASSWTGLRSEEAVSRYRELPALMGPYHPHLIAGCAETPAEACRSRYSTALRHKLQQAEALAALDSIPPFLMSAFNSALLVVEQSQHLVKPGNYLWELIYPHAPGTCHPVYNPHGKYAVKLYVDGAYRKVVVDDAMPVDQLGRPLLTVTVRKELWPAILAKAVFKALGINAMTAMTTDPDTIIACLMGNWIPQYVNPKRASVATVALLMTYQQQLAAQQHAQRQAALAVDAGGGTLPMLDTPTEEPPPPGHETEARKKTETAKPGEEASSGARSGGMKTRAGMAFSLGRSKAKDVVEEKNAAEKLFAEEYCPPSDDEPIERRPFLMCGVRTRRESPTALHDGTGNDGQAPCHAHLYAIVDVVGFRNTLALRVRTTPRCDLVPEVFESERDARDVQGVLAKAAAASPQPTLLSSEKASSVDDLWLTYEELSEAMDSVVVWHNFDQRYLHSATLDTTNTAVAQIGAATAATASPLSAPAGANVNHSSCAGVTPTWIRAETWIGITSDAPEELAIVIASPPLMTPSDDSDGGGGGGEAAAAGTGKSANAAGGAGEAAASSQKAGKSSSAAAASKAGKGARKKEDRDGPSREILPHSEAPVAPLAEAVPSSPVFLATPLYGGDRTPAKGGRGNAGRKGEGNALEEKKCIQVEYFAWGRAEPLSRAFDVHYGHGKTTSHLLWVRPGTHIYKVSIPEMSSSDRITLYANARVTIRANLLELLKAKKEGDSALFHVVSDAGVHPAVESAGEETVWFKRRLSVAADTKLTLVLSTLLPSEDAAAHRYSVPLTQAFPSLTGGAPGSGGGKGAARAGAGGSKSAGAAAAASTAAATTAPGGRAGRDDLDRRVCDVPILKFTRLMLVDLDRYGERAETAGCDDEGHRAVSEKAHAKAGEAILSMKGSALPAALSGDLAPSTTPGMPSAETAGDPQTVSKAVQQPQGTPPTPAILVGYAGRLPMLTLRPNTRGYLLMAYTSIPASAAEAIKSSLSRGSPLGGVAGLAPGSNVPVPPANPRQSSPAIQDEASGGSAAASGAVDRVADGGQLTSDLSSASARGGLYGKGQWKLTIRSDHNLQQFEPVLSDQQVVPFNGYLRRGGAAMNSLLRYTITIAEPTHVSLLLSVKESVPVPFAVTITRGLPVSRVSIQDSANAGAQARNEGDAAVRPTARPPSATAAAKEDVIFSAAGYRSHAFIPDVLLSPTTYSGTRGPNATGAAQPRGDKSAATSGGVHNAAGGGGATFTVEARVPAAVAAEWDELCRQAQEAAFREKWQQAIETAEARRAADMAELTADREAFLAKKMEELEAREGFFNGSAAGGEAARSNSRDVSAVHGGRGSPAVGGGGAARRGRSVDRKKSSVTATVPPGSFSGSEGRRASRSFNVPSVGGDARGVVLGANSDAHFPAMGGIAAAAADSSATGGAAVDSTPEDLAVTFRGTFFLSSAKAEVRNATPQDDGVAQIRSIWKGFAFDCGSAADNADSASSGAAAVSGAGGGGGGSLGSASSAWKATKTMLVAAQQQLLQQKENEEQLRGTRGHTSRQAFLENPMNVLEPHLLSARAVDAAATLQAPPSARGRSPHSSGNNNAGGGSGAPSKEAGGSGSGSARRDHAKGSVALDGGVSGAGHLLICEDSEETNFSHAAPLSPSQYSVKLLPLRAVEVCLPEPVDADAAQAQAPPLGAERHGREVLHSSAGKRSASGAAARAQGSSQTGPGTAAAQKERPGTSSGGAASAGASGASSAAAFFTELLQQEEEQRAKAAFWTLVREPLANFAGVVTEAAQAERDRLRASRTENTRRVASFWEDYAEAKKAAVASAGAASAPTAACAAEKESAAAAPSV